MQTWSLTRYWVLAWNARSMGILLPWSLQSIAADARLQSTFPQGSTLTRGECLAPPYARIERLQLPPTRLRLLALPGSRDVALWTLPTSGFQLCWWLRHR
jgi:hypothetical protein